MNFAPYQDESPETERALSPPPSYTSPRASPPVHHFSSTGGLPPFIHSSGHGMNRYDIEGGRLSLGAFDTSLPIRIDYEAMLAYLLLPPAGGVLLLLLEHKSDYVRYA